MQEYALKVACEDSGRRLDVFLLDFATRKKLGFSRTHIQKLIQDGFVKLKGMGKLKSHHKIKAGDELTVRVEEKNPDTLLAEDIPLDIVYEDRDLAVINKPCGLVVHPAPGNYAHTLVNALLHHFKNLSDINPQRPGIVHRLDKETSGLLVVAKNNAAHLGLASQFAKHSVKKIYLAVVKGRVEFDEDTIEAPIVRHPLKRKNMSVGYSDKAKFAKTVYRTLKRGKDMSLLELEPFTGRTHQLRVHLAFLGHPILGDTKYGRSNDFKRLCLHAKELGFIHPGTGKFVEFSSQAPKEFAELFK